MKYNKHLTSTTRGFTLIELLIVIGIIATLAGIGFAGFRVLIENAKKTSAQACMAVLITSCDDYYTEYNFLPDSSNSGTNDEEKPTDNTLMAPLLGLQSAQNENFKLRSFFEFKDAKGKNNAAHDGLERTQTRAELLGPWLNTSKENRYYRVVLNYDYDEFIVEPSAIGSEQRFDRHVLIYHAGKDGKTGGKNNDDNVYSWEVGD